MCSSDLASSRGMAGRASGMGGILRLRCGFRSGHDPVVDVALHVGQAEIAPREAVGEPLVVHAHEVEQGGLPRVGLSGQCDHHGHDKQLLWFLFQII